MRLSREAASRGERHVTSLRICDALMIDPNDREILNTFDELTMKHDDPLESFPVPSNGVHVATAAGRARVLMMQRRLPEALELMGAIFEVAPDLGYVDWVRRWMLTPVAAELPWSLLERTVFVPSLRMALKLPVPPPTSDPRVANVRAVVEILRALAALHDRPQVHAALSIALRRLPDPSAALEIARAAAARFPDNWQLQAACMNALCDLDQPEQALVHAREALRLDPNDSSPLHDVAHAFLAAERAPQALALFSEIAENHPEYPGISACLHYARFLSTGDAKEREALLALRDRRPWDADVRRLADRLDPPRDYVDVLPAADDALAREAPALLAEIAEVVRGCGADAAIALHVHAEYGESPSALNALEAAAAQLGARAFTLQLTVDKVQSPDPLADKGVVPTPIFTRDGARAKKVQNACEDARALQAVAQLAERPFRRETWDAAAAQLASAAPVEVWMSVLTNPPPPPAGFDGMTWAWRCQIATAVIVSHLGSWESGPMRVALQSMLAGPSDWVTSAAIVALAWRAVADPSTMRAEAEKIFAWLRTQLPREGFTTWEHPLVSVWRDLEPQRKELEGWLHDYTRTFEAKSRVRIERRYGGLTLEQYARFIAERDQVSRAAQGAPSPALIEVCQRHNLDPARPYIPEWQEALNANPRLMQRFLATKESFTRR